AWNGDSSFCSQRMRRRKWRNRIGEYDAANRCADHDGSLPPELSPGDLRLARRVFATYRSARFPRLSVSSRSRFLADENRLSELGSTRSRNAGKVLVVASLVDRGSRVGKESHGCLSRDDDVDR